ncbi:hypothetical protein CA54_22750 [Symmachiella macrocystis]|uniref:Uncharacterized protein n=1 Tax=Symmachiella macrocystis TaxID=2527985 RepID=A0A5C6BMR0_9PLAN|nr:hypothetical protein CA54_22750 [Symmachiella macrocystis]
MRVSLNCAIREINKKSRIPTNSLTCGEWRERVGTRFHAGLSTAKTGSDVGVNQANSEEASAFSLFCVWTSQTEHSTPHR